ncbi:MAG: hypothetical protein ACRC8S_03130 [Fimbriiglobus sp.]
MKRFLRSLAALSVLGGTFGTIGCANLDSRPSVQSQYDHYVDHCWPERYSYQARESTVSYFANHVENGKILDQYVQNGDFELGSDKLTPGGLIKLDTLARKRPTDGQIFIQKTRDLTYDPAKVSDYVTKSAELDSKRATAITTYLNATTAGRGINYTVTVIDPSEQTMPASGPASSVRGFPARFQSGIGGVGGTAAAGVGGGGAPTVAVPTVPTAPPAGGGTGSGPR